MSALATITPDLTDTTDRHTLGAHPHRYAGGYLQWLPHMEAIKQAGPRGAMKRGEMVASRSADDM